MKLDRCRTCGAWLVAVKAPFDGQTIKMAATCQPRLWARLTRFGRLRLWLGTKALILAFRLFGAKVELLGSQANPCAGCSAARTAGRPRALHAAWSPSMN